MNNNIESRHGSRLAELAEHTSDEVDGPFTVSGVAIGPDEVTFGMHGPKFWPAEELRSAAGSLRGAPLTKNHDVRHVEDVVGQVTRAAYRDGLGVVYEAEIDDAELAEKIDRGRLDVSVHAVHADGGEDEEGRMIAEDIEFIDLSIVPIGAAESNSVEFGENEALMSAELSADIIGDELDEAGEEAILAEVHEPDYDDSDDDRSWSALDLEDFTDEDWEDLSHEEKSEIAGHFMVSETTFPPANFGSLGFEVVFPDGDLSLAGLRAAKSRAPQSDLADSEVVRVQRLATRLANREFDAGWTMEGNQADAQYDGSSEDESQTEQASEASGSESTNDNENMTEDNQIPDDAEYPDMTRAELEARVDELEAENEDLDAELSEVRMTYAEELADGEVFEATELAEKYEFSELKEKFESTDASLVEDEGEPNVEAGGDGEAEASTDPEGDELTEEEELEQRLDTYKEQGMGDSAAARNVRAKLSEVRE